MSDEVEVYLIRKEGMRATGIFWYKGPPQDDFVNDLIDAGWTPCSYWRYMLYKLVGI